MPAASLACLVAPTAAGVGAVTAQQLLRSYCSAGAVTAQAGAWGDALAWLQLSLPTQCPSTCVTTANSQVRVGWRGFVVGQASSLANQLPTSTAHTCTFPTPALPPPHPCRDTDWCPTAGAGALSPHTWSLLVRRQCEAAEALLRVWAAAGCGALQTVDLWLFPLCSGPNDVPAAIQTMQRWFDCPASCGYQAAPVAEAVHARLWHAMPIQLHGDPPPPDCSRLALLGG